MSHPADSDTPPTVTLPAIDVFPVGIGHYDDDAFGWLDVTPQVGVVNDLLRMFGGQECRWATPERERDTTAVLARLEEWATAGGNRVDGSVLYWVGHGWSDGKSAALATKNSLAQGGTAGISPEQLARFVRRRHGQPGCHSWTLIIIDACRSQDFTQLLADALCDEDDPQLNNVILLGVSGEGAATLGSFTQALRAILETTFLANKRIALRELMAELKLPLGAKPIVLGAGNPELVRIQQPVAAWMTAPFDTIRYLEDVLRELTPDRRRHFMAKARGDEYGELSWFFQGRAAEMAAIAGWLRAAESGMLVVCGRAGSGKSALLGNVMVQSLPALRDALARRGLATALDTGERPLDDVFDAVLHLSGLTMPQIVTRIAARAGLGTQPSRTDPASGIATDLDWLAAGLATVTGPAAVDEGRPFTVLCDALDECTDPLDTARSLLARIAAVPGVRVVVGTRDSTTEAFGEPPEDTNILDALATAPPRIGSGPGHGESEMPILVPVARDPSAIHGYVRSRLLEAKTYGRRQVTVRDMDRVTEEDVERVAAVIASKDREFLYARIAVFELIEEASLLTPERADQLGELLEGQDMDLFNQALDRLARMSDYYAVLLRALALARGRGVPATDSLWAITATAVNPFGRLSSDRSAWTERIGSLLDDAAAYIIVDTPTADAPSTGSTDPARGRPADGAQPATGEPDVAEYGTVYRLAHRTFDEFFDKPPEKFLAKFDRRGDYASGPGNAAAALLEVAAARAAGTDPGSLPTYLVRHLSGHIADTQLWDTLADDPRVLDRLDPDAVTADALRTLFGHRDIPPAVAGIIGARDALLTASPADRAGLRQLATTTYSTRQVIDEPTASWGICAARARSVTPHVRLSGHTDSLNSVRSLTLPGRGTIIASASDDGAIRLWDPMTATPIGSPLTGHEAGVEDLTVFHDRDGRVMLASAGSDRVIRRWDVYTGREAGPPMAGHAGRIFGICTIPGEGPGRPERLATAGTDETVRIWDPWAGDQIGEPLTGHWSWVWAVCPLPRDQADVAAGRTLLASCGADRTVRVWDLSTGQQVGDPLTGHEDTVFCVCVLHADGRALLASAGGDGAIGIWDPLTRELVGEPITGYPGNLLTVCEHTSGGRALLATSGYDGTVVVWDPATRARYVPPLLSDAGPAWGICTVPSQKPGGPELLASTGTDGTVRVWNPMAGQEETSQQVFPYTESARRVQMLPRQHPDDPALLVTTGFGGRVRVWDPVAGRAVDHPLAENVQHVSALCMVPGQGSGDRVLLAGTGRDRRVHLWDPGTGREVGRPLGRSQRVAWAGCALEYPARSKRLVTPVLLALTGVDPSIELWDPVTGHLVAQVRTGHAQGVVAVCAVPGYTPDGRPNGQVFLATAGADKLIGVWDPGTGAPATSQPLFGRRDGHTDVIQDICSFPWDGGPASHTMLATVSFDGTLRLWDPVAGRQQGENLTGHRASVLGVSPLPGTEPTTPTLLITAGYDRTVRIWDPRAGNQVGEPFTGHEGRVWNAGALPGLELTGKPGRYPLMASTGDDGTVRIWDPNTGRAVGEPLSDSPDIVRAIIGSAVDAGSLLLVGDGTVQSWDFASAALNPLPAPPWVTAATVHHDSGRGVLLAGDAGGLVHVTDPASGLEVRPPVRVDDGAVLALCEVDGSFIAAGGRGGDVVVFRLRHDTGAAGDLTPRRLRGHHGPVRDLCLVPCGTEPLLASAGDDGTIRVWDMSAGTEMRAVLTGHDGAVWSLAVLPGGTPAGARLASASADGTIRCWNPLSGRQVTGPLSGHTDQVRALTCVTTADGRVLLVSGSFDGSIRLWDCATGTPVHTIPVRVPVHALRQQPPDRRSAERTANGATLIVGLRSGVLVLDLNSSFFPRDTGSSRSLAAGG